MKRFAFFILLCFTGNFGLFAAENDHLKGIPHINYLTLIDGFIIVTFLILAASVVFSIVVDKLNRSERKETGDRLDYISRWAFPSVYLLSSLILAALFFVFS